MYLLNHVMMRTFLFARCLPCLRSGPSGLMVEMSGHRSLMRVSNPLMCSAVLFYFTEKLKSKLNSNWVGA